MAHQLFSPNSDTFQNRVCVNIAKVTHRMACHISHAPPHSTPKNDNAPDNGAFLTIWCGAGAAPGITYWAGVAGAGAAGAGAGAGAAGAGVAGTAPAGAALPAGRVGTSAGAVCAGAPPGMPVAGAWLEGTVTRPMTPPPLSPLLPLLPI